MNSKSMKKRIAAQKGQPYPFDEQEDSPLSPDEQEQVIRKFAMVDGKKELPGGEGMVKESHVTP